LFDDRLIGGAIVISHPRGRYYLARIFIDPDYHRRGLGTRAMELLFETYPEARLWNLETPPWNVRTRAFYEKLGFTVIRETKDDIFFKRVME
jgi:ribosomal protein S18 acetylase RimI-like enzyme